MPTPPRRLPLLVERAVTDVSIAKIDAMGRFDLQVKGKLSDERKTVTCLPGCAHCCYHPIMISILEAIPLYQYLEKKGKWTAKLKAKCKETSDLQYGTSFEVWLYSMIPCPLLDDKKKCSGYEARPLICRAYLATSDPQNCHPHHIGPETEIVDRQEVVSEFHAFQEKTLLRHKLQFLAVPIGKALLLAEQICIGKLDFSGVDLEVLKEYVAKSLWQKRPLLVSCVGNPAALKKAMSLCSLTRRNSKSETVGRNRKIKSSTVDPVIGLCPIRRRLRISWQGCSCFV